MAISATAKAGWRVLQLAGEHATLIHVSSTQADRYRVSRRPTTDQPTQSSQAGRPRPFQWAGRVVLAALAFLLVSDLVLVVPGYVVDRDLGRDGRLAPAELVKAKNDARATLLQGIGGLVLLLGALAAWRQLQPGREQLNVAGMLRNRRLARAIADTSMAELRRQLVYKTTWYGAELVTADRFYPSSKTCSACGWVKAKLTLAERTFQCDACGFRMDRDLNAAHNLVRLVESSMAAGSGPEAQNARGANHKTQSAGQAAVKREPRMAAAGETGTVRP